MESVSLARQKPLILVKCSHVWRFEDLGLLKNHVFYSSTFTSDRGTITDNCMLQWRLKFVIDKQLVKYKKKQGTMDAKFTVTVMEVNLGLDTVLENKIFTEDASLSIIDEDGDCLQKSTLKRAEFQGMNCSLSINLRDINVPLTIECKLAYYAEVPLQQCIETENGSLLESLLNDQKFTDVTLRVKNRDFKSHRAILATKSPVFEAMFSHENVLENTERVVEIKDMEPDVAEQMLKFVYTGKVPEDQVLNEMGSDLLTAGDRYGLDKLKALAERHLAKSDISISDAAKLLVLADMHSAEILKNRVAKFIADNLREIRHTEEWNQVVKNDPRLLNLILDKMEQNNYYPNVADCILDKSAFLKTQIP